MTEALDVLDFEPWPKTPRLFRDMVITEKIDGTNSAVIVTEDGRVGAQSRNRLIYPGKTTDNFGFAGWVHENAGELRDLLGPGRHFGEWWGSKVARGYGLTGGERRFSLFNVSRYKDVPMWVDGLELVPVLYEGLFSQVAIDATVEHLREGGSVAAPGFDRPEGVIVFHSAAQQVFKVLLENDSLPKALTA